MKKSKFFVRTLLLLAASITLVACGSDDNGEVKTTVDVEAVYSVNAAKAVNDYAVGETLATVTDADGAVTQASLDSGSLPDGTALNGSTGELTVTDVGALVAGAYSLAITTEDATGGTSDHSISITLSDAVDTASSYVIPEAKTVQEYSIGESVATVSDADGDIVSATLEGQSELPAGTMLNETTGEINVEDTTLLVPGTYEFSILTEDAQGGTTVNMIAIIFNQNPDVAAIYTVIEAKPVKDYVQGESVATVSDENGDITSAVLGTASTLPAGTALNEIMGEITVMDPTLLVPGTYEIEITTEDAQGGTTVNMISITFNQNPDVAAIYTVTEAKPVEEYVQGESVATVSDGNGNIISAVLGAGAVIPTGTALSEITGEITVLDPTLLVPGNYEIEVTTEDENGGTTIHMVTLVFNENPVIVNINSGGDALDFTDISYMADQFFVGTSLPFTPTVLPEINNTDMDELYHTERYGADFGYAVELENGTYKVILHFVEIYWGAPTGNGSTGGLGDRVFDVSLEGVVVKNDYDIFADVGALIATQEEFEVTLTDGMLNIDFLASVDNAKISAIEIEKIN